MYKQILAIALGTIITQTSYAFISEIELSTNSSYSETEYEYNNAPDDETTSDTSSLGLNATVYFKQVDDTVDAPLAEAVFIQKVGGINLNLSQGDSDFKYKDPVGGTTKSSSDTDSIGLTLHAIFDTFILEAENNKFTRERKNWETENTYQRLGFGAYMTDHSTIIVSLLNQEIKDSNGYISSEDSGINAAVKFFIPFNNTEKSLSVGGSLSILGSERRNGEIDDAATAALDLFADYYLSNQLALKLSIYTTSFVADEEDDSGDDIEITSVSQTISFGCEYFISNQFAIFGNLSLTSGEYEEEVEWFGGSDKEEGETTGSALQLGIKGRF